MPSKEKTIPEIVAQPVELSELMPNPKGDDAIGSHLKFIEHLKVKLNASLGNAQMSIGELMALKEGSVIKLDASTDETIEICLNGEVIARGTMVVVDDNFGITLTEIIPVKFA